LVSAGGAQVDSGWTLTLDDYTRLNSWLRIATDISIVANTLDYLTVIDTSSEDITVELDEDIEIGGLIKNFKVTGPYNLILTSAITEFSNGTNELVISDSATIFLDSTAGGVWQIFYNNEWKTKVVEISSAEILAMGTTPIELLPAPGAGKYYDIDRMILKYTYNGNGYNIGEDLGIGDGNNNIKIIPEFWLADTVSQIVIVSDISYPSLENTARTLKTLYGSDPASGNGTIQAIIKYRTLTF